MQDINEKWRDLDKQKNKTIAVRLTSLTFSSEQPVERIEGRAQSGSISVDGDSSVRRTCQISLVAENANIIDKNWALKTKFKAEVGILDERTQEYIWFNQGIYVVTSFTYSRSVTSYNISISGKDKMCLLNGDMGGNLNSSVDFGKMDEIDANGNISTINLPVKDIIREAVHQYGREPFHNIVINDLDQTGLELLEYRYDTPLYLLREAGTDDYENMRIGGAEEDAWVKAESYDSLTSNGGEGTEFTLDGVKYQAAKIEYGETAGYRETDLTYPGDLIASIGESLTSILDKIKNFLGDFEYFYDLDGRFIFQRKKSSSWSPFKENMEEEGCYESSSPYSYVFSGTELFTAFNNTPNIGNIKNDFTVWGTKKGVTGKELPAHMRYAIDVKPQKYTSISVADDELVDYNKKYNLSVKGQNSKIYIAADSYSENGDTIYCDWREIIYQMAKDYSKYNHLDDFELKIIEANKADGLYFTGRTGYEQYYLDMQGFWRLLYDPVGANLLKETRPKQDSLTSWAPTWSYAGVETFYSKTFEKQVIRIYSQKESAATSRMAYQEIPKLENGKNYTLSGQFFLKKPTDRQLLIRLYKNDYKNEDGNGLESGNEILEKVYENVDSKLKFFSFTFSVNDNELDAHKEKVLKNILYIGLLAKKDSTSYPADSREEDYLYLCDLKLEEGPDATEWTDYSGGADNYFRDGDATRKCWNKSYFEYPEDLIFDIDFLDTEGELSTYSVAALGPRTKVVNDNTVKAIRYRTIPNIIFYEDKKGEKSGYRYFKVNTSSKMFSISARGKSAQEAIENLLKNHTNVNESISITSLPIYYLEPNSKIYVNDPESTIAGEYIVSKFTIPLQFNGTMNITATKVLDTII